MGSTSERAKEQEINSIPRCGEGPLVTRIVKRAGKDEKGNWLLVSDHEQGEPAPWPEGAVMIGEVKWSAVEW